MAGDRNDDPCQKGSPLNEEGEMRKWKKCANAKMIPTARLISVDKVFPSSKTKIWVFCLALEGHKWLLLRGKEN